MLIVLYYICSDLHYPHFFTLTHDASTSGRDAQADSRNIRPAPGLKRDP